MSIWIITMGIFYIIINTGICNSFAGNDYCQSEAFKARCRENEFITMTYARYGRMEIGRCIKKNYGSCSVNVLSVADRMCSGRHECTIRVTNVEMDHLLKTNCTGAMDLSRYLEADYRCDKALTAESSCAKPLSVQVQSGHITSNVLNQTGCGNKSSPWILEAQPGQTLNISLIDFNWGKRTSTSNCDLRYGYVIDLQTDQMEYICGGGPRTSHIYHSSTNIVQIVLEPNMARRASFALKYRAIGCPDLLQPKDAILHRKGNKTIVECHSRKQQWHLKCEGTQWIGVIGNCTQQAVAIARLAHDRNGGFGIPHGIAIFIVGVISLVISCTIIFIGVMVLRRYSIPKPMYPQTDMERNQQYHGTSKDIYNQQEPNPQQQSNNIRCVNPNLHRNEYMHIWEHPLPEPGIEDYQLPLHENNSFVASSHSNKDRRGDNKEIGLLSNMKYIHDEMSRDLEKYSSKLYADQLMALNGGICQQQSSNAGNNNETCFSPACVRLLPDGEGDMSHSKSST